MQRINLLFVFVVLVLTSCVGSSPTPMYYSSHSLFAFTDMEIVPNSGTWIVDQSGLVVQNCMYEVSAECLYKNTIYSLDYYGGISGIDFLAPNDGWVVGVPSSISHWNGTKWEIQRPNDEKRVFRDIGFADSNNGWTVGYARLGETSQTLEAVILHWNGSEWQDVSLLKEIGRNDFSLNAINVVSENDVWVVGDTVLHWNGTNWQEVPTPHYTQELGSVSALSAIDVWVAGGGFVMHWDGDNWTTTRIDNVDNVLAVSHDNVWVAGTDLYHCDGKEWKNADYQGGIGNSIVVMKTAPDGTAWALTNGGNVYMLGTN